ncbi:glucuronate isomerase [Paenarthrobacter sp. Z7-10]|uniref:glucuronate isomerase n=1 Tax=Paenarthrobacter sp. Z7-10 TaxID=2787635 RepID=UPI0022A9F38B|nr:glucuronate isomerase [Paenarthrobacter sp. Z7-10]MCZ2402445.1 glucuronate isomerase [Paenarthrobacter sp. Z7-10]
MSENIAAEPDRLLPADPGTRAIARRLLALVEQLPILSPHGHVDAAMILRNTPFPDPATLLVTPDHYVTRVIHASGIPLHSLGVRNPTSLPEPAAAGTGAGAIAGAGIDAARAGRDVWRAFVKAWPLFEGTASGYWFRQEFEHVFRLDISALDAITPAADDGVADGLFDQLSARLREPDFRPRKLFSDFNIEVLATTDDPLDDLSAHAALAADPTFPGRVLPTFRPDAYIKFHAAGWAERVERLISVAGDGHSGYPGYLQALENRRQYFVNHGAVSADHGSRTAGTLKLPAEQAQALFDKARRGDATAEDADAFEAHMMYQMARMSVADGLVMTLHPGVFRNHHRPTFESFGADTGHDIPFPVSFTEGLRPLLEDFGTVPGFHFIPFTVDETVFSREIAPLAGFYPAVYIGAPWWFLDAPDAMLRFRSAVTETAGFSRSSGFIDDTRAFCSIPARHNTSRRIEASFLARLVAERRISETRAADIIVDIVDAAPRRAFKL